MKRNCRFEIRFSKDELSYLTKKARKAKLSNAAFIRRAIYEREVKEAPPADVPLLLRDVRRVGYNVDQLMKVANSQRLVDVPRLRVVLGEIHDAAQAILRAYTVPKD